jgi:DNA-binding NarL/FixJ family response regulator
MGVRDRQLVRILVADQHRIIRTGIKTLLTETGSWQRFEVEEAESTEEAIAMVSSGEYPVVLMEYNLPGRGGIKATEIIHSRWPTVHVIAMTDSDDGRQAERILRAGAKGCILKNVELDMLIAAIRTVMAGRRFLSNEIAQQLLDPDFCPGEDPLAPLSAREKEVLLMILNGSTDKEIAARMGIAKRTVDKHRQHINYKLGVRTPRELLQFGIRLGLVKI